MTRMEKTARMSRIALGTLGAGALLGAAVATAAPELPPAPQALPPAAVPQWSVTLPPGVFSGYTRASNQSDLAFPVPGVISAVYIKMGDAVKVGQVIAQQDDAEEKAKLAAITAEAENADQQIQAALADRDKKRVDLKRTEEVFRELIAKGQSNSEVDSARVDVKIGEISVKFREGEAKEKKAQVALQVVRVNQKKLLSPLTGVVSKVDLHAGEGTDIQRPTGIQVVQNDPLWVDVNIPSAQTAQLRKGQSLNIQYDAAGEWTPAQVILLSDVADPRANTRLVRLQMANPVRKDGTRKESGLQVFVKLPDALVANPGGEAPPAPAAGAPR